MSIYQHLRDRVDEWLWSRSWLLDHLSGEDPKVRLWAFDRLSHCYPDAAVDPARSLIEDEDSFLRQTATEHLGAHGNADDSSMFREKYTDAAPAWKGTLLNAMADQGDEHVLEIGQQLLQRDGANINLILSFVEALKRLDTPAARKQARDMYRTTQTEAVFSALTGYIATTNDPEDLDVLTTSVLEKLADNAMIKVRHFCHQCRSALFLYPPGTSLTDHPPEERSPDPLLKTIAPAALAPPSPADHPEIQQSLRYLTKGNRTAALERLGAWAERSSGPPDRNHDSRRPREIIAFLRPFASLPDGLADTEVPGQPLLRLCELGLLAWLHHEHPHPITQLNRARQESTFPDELYELDAPFLLDEISLVCSKREVDHDRLLNDTAPSAPLFRRVKALKILTLREEPRVLPKLVSSLNDDRSLVYKTASRALVRFGPASIPPLADALENGRLKKGGATAADVLRRIPIPASADRFLEQFDTLVGEVGLDPIVSFATDLAQPETADALRKYLDRNLLLVGEQLGIVCKLYDMAFPEQERIEQKMNEKSEQNRGGPQFGSPFPGGTPGTGDGPEDLPGGPPTTPDLTS